MIRRVAISDDFSRSTAVGVVTCALRRRGKPSEIYALSCRHVFSISLKRHPRHVSGHVHLSRSSSNRIVGRTSLVMGRLQNQPGLSFDAQLAQVTSVRVLRAALGGLRFTGIARYVSDLPESCWIATTRGTVSANAPRDIIRAAINYTSVLSEVVHLQLIQLSVSNGATRSGDSGGSVMSHPSGGTLLGMHIAGGGRTTYFIPAWQLFAPGNFAGASSTEHWDLVNP